MAELTRQCWLPRMRFTALTQPFLLRHFGGEHRRVHTGQVIGIRAGVAAEQHAPSLTDHTDVEIGREHRGLPGAVPGGDFPL